MTNKRKHYSKKHFSRYCLLWFYGSRVLERHLKKCAAINYTKSAFIPEKNE